MSTITSGKRALQPLQLLGEVAGDVAHVLQQGFGAELLSMENASRATVMARGLPP